MAGNGHIQIDDLGAVQLSVGVDSGSLEAARTQIEKLVEELQKKCKLSLTIDTVAAQNALSQLQNRQSRAASNASKHVGLTAPLRRQRDREQSVPYVRNIERYTAAIDIAQKKINQGFKAPDVKTAISNLQRLLDQYKITGEGANDLKVAMDTLNSAMAGSKSASKLRDTLSATLTPEWFKAQESRLTSQYANADPAMLANAQRALTKVKELGSAAELTDEQVEALNRALAVYKSRMAELGTSNTAVKAAQDEATAIANLKAQYEDYMSKYGQNLQRNLPLMEKFRKFGADLSSGALTGNAATQQFAALREEARKSGVEIETVRQRMTHLFGQHFNTALIMLAIRGLRMALRQLWQDIKEVNEALVQTQIVTGLTGAALEAYTDKAYAAAEKSKDKVTNILSEATAFGRLGYDSDLSVQLAQLTSMYSKLGDVETSDATDAITALMKAFDLKNADEIELALDKMIYVGNNVPISAAGLGEGLNNAASALSSAGNSLEQTLALLMAANATVQDPAKSSTAMRTITARIRNTKAELEELGEELDEKYNTVAKYQKELRGLTGVDILDAAGKNFRSTYAILSDLAKEWATYDDATKAAVTTMLAGQRNQDIFASLMKNFPSAEEAMAGISDAAGLMDEKFKAVEDSISGALSGLSNAWSKFSNTLFNSKDIVSFVRLLTSLVSIFEKLAKTMGGGAMITGALALTSFFMKMRQFNQVWPQMQATSHSLSQLLNAGDYQGAAQALSSYTKAQQYAIINTATLSDEQRTMIMEQQGIQVATNDAALSTTAFGMSVDGLKMKMQAFVQSGNAWITLITLIIQIGLTLANILQQDSAVAKQAADNIKQIKRDSITSVKNTLNGLASNERSVETYQQQLTSIQDKLRQAQAGSDEYKEAQTELYDVEQKIINVFGEQAGAVRDASESLDHYVERLGEIEERSRYLELTGNSNLYGLNQSIKLFGVGATGSGSITIENPGLQFGYVRQSGVGKYSAAKSRADDELDRLFGDYLSNFITGYFTTGKETNGLIPGTKEGTATITSITIGENDKTVAEIVDMLDKQITLLRSLGDTAGAAQVSLIASRYKELSGYNDAKPVFEEWAELSLKYGDIDESVRNGYLNILTQRTKYIDALLSGDQDAIEDAKKQLDLMVGTWMLLASDKGYDWAVSFLQGVIDGWNHDANVVSNSAESSGARFASMNGKPSNYDSSYAFTDQGNVTSATGRVGALDADVKKFLYAKTAFSDIISDELLNGDVDADWSLINVDAAKEAIDLINEYFGTNFDELTEDNANAIAEMFDSASKDIYGAIGGSISDALNYAQDNEVDMGNIVDVDSGLISINALISALGELPESADQAGALAAAGLASELQSVAGMEFSLVSDGNSIKVVASGGSLLTESSTKPRGGGGGHHSQISDDIDNVERLIKLFKELLNYYDEGSEQWIARQRQIIDKYKAGVEIAMAEYNRLIKKGLKQTDDDVKKIVDTILEYQEDIFDESKKLWEAVRQNQIDAIQHTKDQNDAAIQLEKTHHDLLISIRNERRELEDELKAARNAYSEVMTPEELDALFSADDYAELMDKLAGIEGDAMALYRDYKEQIAAVSEDETYMIEHITDEFQRQYDLKMKEYEIAKAELGVAKAQQQLENVKNEQTVMMLIGGRWQWVADPEKVLEAEQALADAEQDLADAQDEYDFQSLIHEMEAQSSAYQQQIDALSALTFSMDALAEQVHLFSDSVYKELLTYLSKIAQQTIDKYAGDTAVPAFAEGGVIRRGGLAMVHGGEPIFSTADAEKLWRFVHDLGDTPINTNGVFSGIARKLLADAPTAFGSAQSVSIDNSINIPGGIQVHGETAQRLIALLKEVVAPYQPKA